MNMHAGGFGVNLRHATCLTGLSSLSSRAAAPAQSAVFFAQMRTTILLPGCFPVARLSLGTQRDGPSPRPRAPVSFTARLLRLDTCECGGPW